MTETNAVYSGIDTADIKNAAISAEIDELLLIETRLNEMIREAEAEQ